MLTGLGQAIAYVDKEDSGILISPSYLKENDFKIGTYLKKIIKEQLGDKPVGLVTFDPDDLENIFFEVDPFFNYLKNSTLNINTGVSLNKIDAKYWTWWRDYSPHAYVELLLSSLKFRNLNAKEKEQEAWDDYYFNKFSTNSVRNTLNLVNSNIKKIGGNSFIPHETTKKELLKKIQGEKLGPKVTLKYGSVTNQSTALSYLYDRSANKNIKENHYRNYKKNHVNTLNTLGLWDENNEITNFGSSLINVYINNKSQWSKELDNEFLLMILIKGKYRQLIKDILEFQKNNLPDNNIKSSGDLRKALEEYFKDKGFVKSNPNRKTSGSREYLTEELQLLKTFKLVLNHGLNKNIPFDHKVGYVFDEILLDKLTEEYYEKYGDL